MNARAALAVLVIALAAACQITSRNPGIPEGYVTVPDYDGAILSAVAPSGNRIVTRRHPNPPEGTLAFWRDAIRAELEDGKGYEQVETSGVTGRSGRAGWEFLFRVTRPEGEYLYLVLVRVEGAYVTVTEAGGREASIRADLPALRDALR